MQDKEWKKQISQIEKDMNKDYESPISKINFGWLSALLMALSIGAGFFAFNRITKGAYELMCSYMSGVSGTPMNGGAGSDALRLGSGFVFIALIILVLALASAGGGIATQRGLYPAVSVLALVLIPLIYLTLQILFDLPPLLDMSSLSSLSGPAPSPISGLKCPS